MNKVLVDTDIIYDLLAHRMPYYTSAAKLFTLADKQKTTIFISALTVPNLNYLLTKFKSARDAKKILNQFKVLINIIPLNEKIIDLALNSDFKDLEDAIQHYSAIENNVEIILTRKLKDYKNSQIPVMTAEDFVKAFFNSK